jgi:hypothetical protein
MQFSQMLYLTEPLSTYYKRSSCSFSKCYIWLNLCQHITTDLHAVSTVMFDWTFFRYYKRSSCSFSTCYVWLNLCQHIAIDIYAVFPTLLFDWNSFNILQEIFMQFQLLHLTEPLSTYYKRSLCSFLNYCLTEPLSTYYKRSSCDFSNCMLVSHMNRPQTKKKNIYSTA